MGRKKRSPSELLEVVEELSDEMHVYAARLRDAAGRAQDVAAEINGIANAAADKAAEIASAEGGDCAGPDA
jgi:hypothetical protein